WLVGSSDNGTVPVKGIASEGKSCRPEPVRLPNAGAGSLSIPFKLSPHGRSAGMEVAGRTRYRGGSAQKRECTSCHTSPCISHGKWAELVQWRDCRRHPEEKSMATAQSCVPAEQQFVLSNIDWSTYVTFSDKLGERNLRLTYDGRNLEFM